MNEYQKSQLKEALMSIVADTAVFLFGVDLGFFGNECLTWTPGATDPNDIAYSVAFAVGSCLLLVLYPRVRECQAFPIAYCVFFSGVLIFCFRRSSSILSRSLQGVGMGILLPWTVLIHLQRSKPGKRVQTHCILLLIFVGSYAIGYLVRLIGGLVERILSVALFSLLCFLGLFMFFFDDTAERLVLRERDRLTVSDQDPSSRSLPDDLYASLLQSEEDDVTSQVDQLIALATEEFALSRCQLFRRYLPVLVRWFLAVLSIAIFPLQIIVQSFPHTVRYWLPKLQDALFSDLLLQALAFLALFAGLLLMQRPSQKWRPLLLLVLSLLCWLLAALCSLEFFFSSRQHPIIPIGKSLLQMAAVVVFVAGVVPQSLNEATQIGTVVTRAWLPSLTFLVMPALLSVFYIVEQLVASKLKNQCCSYVFPAALYLLLFALRSHFADLNDLSLCEVSRVTGLVLHVSWNYPATLLIIQSQIAMMPFPLSKQQTDAHKQKGY